MKPKKVRIKEADGLVLAWINFTGFLSGIKPKAWTSFWNTIYVTDKKYLKNKKIIRHEMMHIKQIEKEGIFLFSIRYCYYALIKGYWNNPYEIEARKAMQ